MSKICLCMCRGCMFGSHTCGKSECSIPKTQRNTTTWPPNTMIRSVPVTKVDKKKVLETLVIKGGMILTVPESEITNEWIINAQHTVIEQLSARNTQSVTELQKMDGDLKQFYKECQRNYLCVTRDNKQQIKLVKAKGI